MVRTRTSRARRSAGDPGPRASVAATSMVKSRADVAIWYRTSSLERKYTYNAAGLNPAWAAMSLVVVAWKPRSANALAAASRMRREPAGKWYPLNSCSRAAPVSATVVPAAAEAASAPAATSGAVPACGAASLITAWLPFSCEQYRIRGNLDLADWPLPAYRPKQALSNGAKHP